MLKQPLFILAPPRSFTTISCAMLGQHPEMYGLPETNLFVADTYGQLSKLYGIFRPRLGHGLLRAITELGLGGQTEHNVDVAMEWLSGYPRVTTKALFEHLMDWVAPKIVIEKSPLHIFDERNLQRMLDAFPDAKYLHLTRHPISNSESVFKISGEVKEREQRTQALGYRNIKGSATIISDSRLHPDNIWLKPHKRVVDFLKHVPEKNQMRMRGEDLLGDPDTYLAVIADWVGVSTSSDAIELMKHPESSPFACYGPHNARMGQDPSFLEKPELRPYRAKQYDLDGPMSWDPDTRLNEETKKLARTFGY